MFALTVYVDVQMSSEQKKTNVSIIINASINIRVSFLKRFLDTNVHLVS